MRSAAGSHERPSRASSNNRMEKQPPLLPKLKKPILLYDGDCRFCRRWIARWQRQTGDAVTYLPFQEAAAKFPKIPRDAFEKSVILVTPEGTLFFGAHAVFKALSTNPHTSWWLWCYERVPFFAPVSQAVYRFVGRRRKQIGGFSAALALGASGGASYFVGSWLFLKGLGIVYLIAFVSFGLQITGLIGREGILPTNAVIRSIRDTVGLAKGVASFPTIFWLDTSDFFLKAVCLAGAVIAVLLILGIYPRLMLVILWLLYLSLVTAGRDFMNFQWDVLLLEAGFLAIFLNPHHQFSVWLLWFLLFKFVFLSGAVKLLSGDPTWRNWSALTYHFETQPLPTALAWYAHHLSASVKKAATGIMLFIELIFPFAIFMPRVFKYAAGIGIALLQFTIMATGNYTFFNLLTIVLVLPLFDDTFYAAIFGEQFITYASRDFIPFGILASPTTTAVLLILLFANLFQLYAFTGRVLPKPVACFFKVLRPFHVFNTYGLFAVMTTKRPEIVIEGSHDGKEWRAYEFPYKPGNLKRRPGLNQPHQPRLDWQLWFAALGTPESNPWFTNLLYRLLEGSPSVGKLLAHNPFPHQPPRYVRALLYEYRFSDPSRRKETGEWWQRTLRHIYFPTATLQPNYAP